MSTFRRIFLVNMESDKSKVVSKSIAKSIGLVMIGITTGILVLLGYQYFNNAPTTNFVAQEIAEVKEASVEEFVNPMIKFPYYKNHSWIKLKGIEELINNQVEIAKKEKRISSGSVYFRDLTNDFKVGENELEEFSPASLMKVPIMIAVLKYAEIKSYTLTTEILFEGPKEANYTEVDLKSFKSNTKLIAGNLYTVNQLIDIMITESDNEATIMLIDFLDREDPTFLQKVEVDLGMVIPEGIAINDNFLTVKKYASFFRTLFNASYLSDENSEKALNFLLNTGYGFGIRQSIPKSVKIAHKFGIKLTENPSFQLHHFGIVYHQKKPFLIGVMTKGNDLESLKGFISDVAYNLYAQVEIQTNNANDGYLQRDLDE